MPFFIYLCTAPFSYLHKPPCASLSPSLPLFHSSIARAFSKHSISNKRKHYSGLASAPEQWSAVLASVLACLNSALFTESEPSSNICPLQQARCHNSFLITMALICAHPAPRPSRLPGAGRKIDGTIYNPSTD